MDELLNEFLTESGESIAVLDVELVKLEQNSNDPKMLANIFRLVHTIKGTCGFLGLPRLESLAHAAEDVLGKLRDGELEVTPEALTLILESFDAIKDIMSALEATEVESKGDDADCLPKPTSRDGLLGSSEFRRQLIEKVKALGAARRGKGKAYGSVTRPGAAAAAGRAARGDGEATIALRKSGLARPKVVAIGSSTGGPHALLKLFECLNGSIPLPPTSRRRCSRRPRSGCTPSSRFSAACPSNT